MPVKVAMKAKMATKSLLAKKGSVAYEPASVLKSTEKAAKGSLMVSERCNACHGRTVRDVLGLISNNGTTYRAADLKYDLKHGRLLALPPGSSAGAFPLGENRKAAPCAGQPMPAASIDEFFRFMQCQLRFEAKHHTETELNLTDKVAETMYPEVEAFVTPNLGATERWVPYHTILGVHELFLVRSIHSRKDWTEKQRFFAIFVFRAHCKADLFTQAQLPLMLKASFWQNPVKAFSPGGPMEKAILAYRKKTGKPLITNCFRIIPERILADDTANLVRSVTNRTMGLLQVAESAYPIMKDKKKSPIDKLNEISVLLQNTHGLGETWAKMITVCLDLAYPAEKMLEKQCDVGTGAVPPLRCLVPKCPEDNRVALSTLLQRMNGMTNAPANNFWTVLAQGEKAVRTKFKKDLLVCAQANTKARHMTAVTLQVQLCEFRQFRHHLARNVYGIPDDETMRGEPDKENKLHPEDFIEVDTKRKVVWFDFPTVPKKTHFEVSIRAAGGSELVAMRVATMCFLKMRSQEPKQQVEKFCESLLSGYIGGEDVADDSPAWEVCHTQLTHNCPLVPFEVEVKNGKKIRFQTTVQAAGGNTLEAERIARLCWAKLKKGHTKDVVLLYRAQLYDKLRQNQSGNNQATVGRKRLSTATSPGPSKKSRRS
jgi:hypothetical protein